MPSEIVWDRLEPWLMKRRKNGNTVPSSVTVSTIAGSTMTTTTAMTVTSNMTIDEKKQLEKTSSEKKEEPVEGSYYIMRGIMILGTGTVILSLRARVYIPTEVDLKVHFMRGGTGLRARFWFLTRRHLKDLKRTKSCFYFYPILKIH